MDGLAKWLGDISWPIVSRLLASMGLGTVTYTGIDTAFDGALQHARDAIANIGPQVLVFLAKAGLFDFMSITSGGLTAGLSWMILKRYAVISGTN